MKKQHFRYLFYLFFFKISPLSHRITTRSKVTFSCYSSDFSSLKAPPIPARCREAGYDIINNVLGLCVCHSVAEYLSSVPLAKADSELLNRTFKTSLPLTTLSTSLQIKNILRGNPGCSVISLLITPSQLFEEMS